CRVRSMGLAVFVLGAWPSTLAAQQQELGPYRRPPPEEDWDSEKGSRATRLATGKYVHDGFYLRLGGGVGGSSDKVKGVARNSEGPAGELDGSAAGFSGATQVALGFTLARGWVLGFSIDTVTAPSGSGSLSDAVGRFEFKTSQLALYGVL